MNKKFRIHPALGLFGFLGVLGIVFEPFFCVFFGFFGFFFWGLLEKESIDERLEANMNRAARITGGLGLLLCFFILFALNKKVSSDVVLFWGSIGYAAAVTSAPAVAYVLDKRG
jgi:hypothetical protein